MFFVKLVGNHVEAWGESMDILSWCSLLGKGRTLDFNWYIYSIWSAYKCEKFGHKTMAVVWKVLIWSLKWLWLGLWPDEDPWGMKYLDPDSLEFKRKLTPLADGHFGVLWGMKGDLDWFFSQFHLPPAGPNSVQPCLCCPASIHEPPIINEFDLTASWIPLTYTREIFERLFPARHMIMKELPGVSVTTFMLDLCHTKHLGTDQYFYASVLWLLCYDLLPGINPLVSLRATSSRP